MVILWRLKSIHCNLNPRSKSHLIWWVLLLIRLPRRICIWLRNQPLNIFYSSCDLSHSLGEAYFVINHSFDKSQISAFHCISGLFFYINCPLESSKIPRKAGKGFCALCVCTYVCSERSFGITLETSKLSNCICLTRTIPNSLDLYSAIVTYNLKI